MDEILQHSCFEGYVPANQWEEGRQRGCLLTGRAVIYKQLSIAANTSLFYWPDNAWELDAGYSLQQVGGEVLVAMGVNSEPHFYLMISYRSASQQLHSITTLHCVSSPKRHRAQLGQQSSDGDLLAQRSPNGCGRWGG